MVPRRAARESAGSGSSAARELGSLARHEGREGDPQVPEVVSVFGRHVGPRCVPVGALGPVHARLGARDRRGQVVRDLLGRFEGGARGGVEVGPHAADQMRTASDVRVEVAAREHRLARQGRQPAQPPRSATMAIRVARTPSTVPAAATRRSQARARGPRERSQGSGSRVPACLGSAEAGFGHALVVLDGGDGRRERGAGAAHDPACTDCNGIYL